MLPVACTSYMQLQQRTLWLADEKTMRVGLCGQVQDVSDVE